MKILAVIGESNSGKTWFSRELKKRYPDHVNIVHSFTSREKREDDKQYGTDHIFTVKKDIEEVLKENPDQVIAFSVKDDEYYMATDSMFRENKLNVYTVDLWGFRQLCNYCMGKHEVYGLYFVPDGSIAESLNVYNMLYETHSVWSHIHASVYFSKMKEEEQAYFCELMASFTGTPDEL